MTAATQDPLAAIRLVHYADVANCFGKSPAWWTKNRTNMQAQGFPEEVPGVKGYYDPWAIRAWLSSLTASAETQPHPAAPGGGTFEEQEALRAQLANRADQLVSDQL